MTPEIQKRIVQFRRGEVPDGYRKTKQGIRPPDWRSYTVGDCLCRVGKPVKVEPEKLYTQIGIRSHGKGLFYKEPVTGESLGNKSVFWIEPDCFVVNIVFAWEQAIGKTTANEVGMIGSHRFPMYRPVDNRVDIDYLISYFLTKRGADILEAASPGGAGRNKTLGQDRFLKSKIILPSIHEQERIAAILTTQDKLIELKERLLEEKKQKKKYLMQQLLTGKKRLPGFSCKWKEVGFDEVFELLPTNTLAREDMCALNGSIRNIHYGDVLTRYAEILDAGQESIPYIEEGKEPNRYTLIHDGDVVIADTAEDMTVGKVTEILNIGSNKMVSGLHTMLCHPKKDIFSGGWLGYYMNGYEYHDQIKLRACGSKVYSISKSEINKTKIRIPCIDEQRRIVDILSAESREIHLLQQSIDAEKQKKKALMQLLLTGIVRTYNEFV